MRNWLCAFVLTMAVASPALAGPEEDALQVVGKWAAAFNASDVDAIVALYAPDAMFLGTGSRTVVLETAEINSPGRVTFVIAKRGTDWKIVHFHRSGVPGRSNN